MAVSFYLYIEYYVSSIGGIGNILSDTGDTYVRLCDILEERVEKTVRNNQYDVLSSTVDGLCRQCDYFSRDMSSTDNTGYRIVRMYDVVICPQNLWNGNINYNDKFRTGIVSPSYRVYSVSPLFDREYVAALLKTRRAIHKYETASGQGASTVRRSLDIKAFRQTVFKVPPHGIQVIYGKTISALRQRMKLAIAIKDAYIEHKRYFMEKMFI